MALRGRRLPEPDLTDGDLRIVIAEYVPSAYRNRKWTLGITYSRMRGFHPRVIDIPPPPPGPQKNLQKGLRFNAKGRLSFGPGAPTLPGYVNGDDFYPVLEWAAHHLARRIKAQHRSVTRADLARRYGLGKDAITTAISRPASGAPWIISDIRGWSVNGRPRANERALYKYRAAWQRNLPARLGRQDEHRILEGLAREFLARRTPPR